MHASVSYHTNTIMTVSFDFDDGAKDAIKALPGSRYLAKQWLVPIMHLPTFRTIFDTIDVEPAVISAYHELLRQMLSDLAGSQHRKGAIGKHIAELMEKHANGIARIAQNGSKQPTTLFDMEMYTESQKNENQPTTSSHEEHPDLALWLRGVKNAQKAEEKRKMMGRRRIDKATL